MKRQSQRGISLLEMMAALAIGMFMLLGLTTILDSALQDTKSQQTAQYQTLFTSAAKRYLDDNYTNLLATITPVGTTVAYPLGTLQGPGAYLPLSFAATNAYQQTPCMLVRKNSATQLEVLLVTEGGTPIPDADIGYVAANAGTGGGAITWTTPNDTTSGLIARGAYGSWQLDNLVASAPKLSDFTGARCSSALGAFANNGHLATALFYGAGQSGADFLYRNPNSNAKYNTMSTPIGMDTNAIKSVGDSCSTPTLALALAMDNTGKILTCDIGSGQWAEPSTNSSWKAPVSTFGDLALLSPPAQAGDVYVALDTGIAHVKDAVDWHTLGQSNDGDLKTKRDVTVGRDLIVERETRLKGYVTTDDILSAFKLLVRTDMETILNAKVGRHLEVQDFISASEYDLTLGSFTFKKDDRCNPIAGVSSVGLAKFGSLVKDPNGNLLTCVPGGAPGSDYLGSLKEVTTN